MTSVYATSPSSPFAVGGGHAASSPTSALAMPVTSSSPSSSSATAISAARYKSSSSPPWTGTSASVSFAAPRKDGPLSANAVPPLHLPRGHDSSDVAALSVSLDGSLNISRSLREIMQSPAFTGQHGVKEQKQEFSTLPATLDEDEDEPTGPFEGPEKLLELWFADSKHSVVEGGLMKVDRQVWENMLDIVKCKVLSVLRGTDVDAYLLSESSMFVFPHKLILKTCGTTTLLLGLERILAIAHDALKAADDPTPADGLSQPELGQIVKRCFYSRKSFMFPERQKGPHRDWTLEVSLLDEFFPVGGAAYTVGKMNSNNWLLYMTTPVLDSQGEHTNRVARPLQLPSPFARPGPPDDQTLEILMTHLSPASCSRFEFPSSLATPAASEFEHAESDRGHLLGAQLSASLGLTGLFAESKIDGFAFEPCGYSANAVIGRPMAEKGAMEDGYWTVHVTPEQDSSYASFETNMATCSDGKGLPWLISRVLTIFEPGRLSVTLFTSALRNDYDDDEKKIDEDGAGLVTLRPKKALEQQQDQGDVLHALQLKGYRRTDRIAYEFEDYDLVFVSFDKIGIDLPRV